MNKKIIISVCTIAVLGNITYFVLINNSENKETSYNYVEPVLNQSTSNKLSSMTKQPSTESNQSNVDDQESNLWEESEEAKVHLHTKPELLPGDLAGEAYVKLDTQRIKQLQMGDAFDIQIPQQGSSIAAEVDYITEHENGDKTVEAFFPGMDRYFSAVFTVGGNNSYAQISTPDGVYILEAQGDNAWITSREALVASHWPEHQDGVMPPAETSAPAATEESTDDDTNIQFDFVVEPSSEEDATQQ